MAVVVEDVLFTYKHSCGVGLDLSNSSNIFGIYRYFDSLRKRKKKTRSMKHFWAVLRAFPKALLAAYFIQAFILSFPMVAMADWLNNHVEMPLATQAQFYAFTYVPNCFKPLYAFLANAIAKSGLSRRHPCFQGRSRSLLLQMCSACMGVLYLFAFNVQSIGGAFGLFFAINIFYSCAELMLGAYLMEILHHGNTPALNRSLNSMSSISATAAEEEGGASFMCDAGAVNAIAGGARSLGALSASIVAVFMYPCDSPNSAPRPATVLSLTGLIAALVAVVGLFLPRVLDDSENVLPAEFLENSANHPEQQQQLSPSEQQRSVSYVSLDATDVVANPVQTAAVSPRTLLSSDSLSVEDAVQETDRQEDTMFPGVDESEINTNHSSRILRRLGNLAAVILLLQGLLVWVSLKDIVWCQRGATACSDLRWWYVFAAFIGSLLLALFLLVRSVIAASSGNAPRTITGKEDGKYAKARNADTEGTALDDVLVQQQEEKSRIQELMLQYGIPSLFLFVYNAMPTSNGQISTYIFYLFYDSSPCKVTQLNLIASTAAVFSYIAYAAVCNRQRIRRVIVVTTVTALGLGLLWLPLASLDLDCGNEEKSRNHDSGDDHTHCSDNSDYHYDDGYYGSYDDDDGSTESPAAHRCVRWSKSSACMEPFAYAAVVQFVTSLTGMLAFTPNTVLATESTPPEFKTMAYAVFLSLIDSGDTASGWITGSIVASLGLSFDSWSRLPDFIWITTACQLGALVLVPFLRDAKPLASLHLGDDLREGLLEAANKPSSRDEDEISGDSGSSWSSRDSNNDSNDGSSGGGSSGGSGG